MPGAPHGTPPSNAPKPKSAKSSSSSSGSPPSSKPASSSGSCSLPYLRSRFSPPTPTPSGVRATETTTTIYLIFQLAYMGRKEFVRWTKGASGWLNLNSPGQLEAEETIRRIRRGDTAVGFWGGFLILAGTLHALTLIPQLPHELFRTSLQVIALYSLAQISKSKKLAKERELNKPAKHAATDATIAVAVSVAPPGPQPDDLNEKILALLVQGGQGRADIAAAPGCPLATTGRRLKLLLDEGRIVRVGSGPKTVYELIEKSSAGSLPLAEKL